MKTYSIALLPGDGIGPEVMAGAVMALKAAGERFGFSLRFTEYDIGGIAIDRHQSPLPQSTVDGCKAADAVLLGAVGGPKWDGRPMRPEQGLLGIRAVLGLYANLRPAMLKPMFAESCPLKDVESFDIMILRELTGGLYFGERGRRETKQGTEAYDTQPYNVTEIERILRAGFEAAMKRDKRLTSVDKANVLETSRLWRETANRLAPEYPEVTLSHMLVDNAAMQLVLNPMQFDVLVTENLFGDILSDEAGAITGSIGLLPSASLGALGTPGLFEPVHGSAPDIAGQDKANPVAAVLSAALLLRYGLGEEAAAAAVEAAVWQVLEGGMFTGDLAKKGEKTVGTAQISREIARYI